MHGGEGSSKAQRLHQEREGHDGVSMCKVRRPQVVNSPMLTQVWDMQQLEARQLTWGQLAQLASQEEMELGLLGEHI